MKYYTVVTITYKSLYFKNHKCVRLWISDFPSIVFGQFFFSQFRKVLCPFTVEDPASFLQIVTGIYRLEYFEESH